MSSLAAADVESVIVYDCRVAGSTARNWAVKFGLRPVCCFEIEYYDIGKVLAVFVLSTKDKKLTTLP